MLYMDACNISALNHNQLFYLFALKLSFTKLAPNPNTRSDFCIDCANGTYAGSTGSSSCEVCPQGYFAPGTASVSCLKCSSEDDSTKYNYGSKYWSSIGSSECDECIADYYMTPADECLPCSWHDDLAADCAVGTTLYTVPTNEGYYRFDNSSGSVYECETENCLALSTCVDGAFGPLCATCEPNYYLRDATQMCEPCTNANAWLGPLIFGVLFFLMLMALYCMRKWIMDWYFR